MNSGDPDLVASHFTDDATHYYTRLGPHEGAGTIGENTKWAVDNLDGQWWFEHGIESGDEAVIEWTMTWRDPKSGESASTAAPSGSACATGRSLRSAPTTTGTREIRRETCWASITPVAATPSSTSGSRRPVNPE